MQPRKKVKLEEKPVQQQQQETETNNNDQIIDRRIQIILKDPQGEQLGNSVIDISLRSSVKELIEIVNHMKGNDEPLLYSFFFDTKEIKTTLQDFVNKLSNFTTETALPIIYHPQALFFVRPITRQSSSLPGHTDSVLSVQFSPNGRNLASGSGDTTVRFWDVGTELPSEVGEKGHKNWVLVIAWSPNGKMLASGGMDCDICLWNPDDGKQIGSNLKGHQKWITSLSWEPLHKNKSSSRLVSASKDGAIRIWNTQNSSAIFTYSAHSKCVTKVLWGGQDLIYSSSEDLLIRVWDIDCKLKRELKGHAHWVNTLCVHTDYALRTGSYDAEEEIRRRNTNQQNDDQKEEDNSEEGLQKKAEKRYNKLLGEGNERLVSGSDDFTLYMWDPVTKAKPIIRMTGHQQPINHVQFSPDGRYIISASYDKSLRLWDGYSGTFICVFRGHVSPVYQIAWSPDSRLFVSGSKDSTMKVWDIKTKKLMFDLPGHADEVYAVDWSPDGSKVASGGKDKMLKVWKN